MRTSAEISLSGTPYTLLRCFFGDSVLCDVWSRYCLCGDAGRQSLTRRQARGTKPIYIKSMGVYSLGRYVDMRSCSAWVLPGRASPTQSAYGEKKKHRLLQESPDGLVLRPPKKKHRSISAPEDCGWLVVIEKPRGEMSGGAFHTRELAPAGMLPFIALIGNCGRRHFFA